MHTQTAPPAFAPKFGKWIRDTGEDEIAKALGVSKWTVFKWRQYADGQDNGVAPKSKYLAEILKFADGKLKAGDVYPTPKT